MLDKDFELRSAKHIFTNQIISDYKAMQNVYVYDGTKNSVSKIKQLLRETTLIDCNTYLLLFGTKVIPLQSRFTKVGKVCKLIFPNFETMLFDRNGFIE